MRDWNRKGEGKCDAGNVEDKGESNHGVLDDVAKDFVVKVCE
jgi:hypothetical protein